MEEIGGQLRQARESMGLTIDEAAEDLKLKPSQLENLENGNKAAFKDVFTLKQVIKDYAKYLGLEYEQLENQFNEFVFEFTSKIPLDKIAEASREKNKEKEQTKEVTSPYTTEDLKRPHVLRWILISLVFVIIAISGYFVFGFIQDDKYVEYEVIPFFFSSRSDVNEFTK